MLGVSDPSQVAPPAWESIPQRAQLIEEPETFFSRQGPMPVAPDSRRGYHRMFLRTQAVLRYQGEFYAIYMLDLSRSGAGLLSPIQLLPFAPIEIWLADGRTLRMTTKNCIRLDTACYRCGVQFGASPSST